MAVTLFEDMGEKSRMTHHGFDLIYDETRVKYATLDEPHLLV